MSNTRWTNEQLDAIKTRGSNLLVSAAAGAGKTAVLVERIIDYLSVRDSLGNFTDVDNLLVVTFTNAAASEMRQRVAEALSKKLNDIVHLENPDKLLLAHLNRQLALIGNASITTLHSFCLEIVRRYFYRLDLDAAFRIAGENEVALLKLEVLEKLFEELYSMESGNEWFLELVEAYGGERSDEMLADITIKLQNFARSMPFPENWLKVLANVYRIEPGSSLDALPWVKELLKTIKFELQGVIEKLTQADIIANLPGGPSIYLKNFKEDLRVVKDFSEAKSWEALVAQMGEFERFGRLAACKADVADERLIKKAQKFRDDAKKAVSELKKKYFIKSTGEIISDLNNLAPLVEGLADLTMKFDKAFTLAKQEKGIVDFTDLEHYCLKILLSPESTADSTKPSEIASELRERFTEVLVDEYQDINLLQEIILNLVSRQNSEQPNMFMVGDVKQSIYRFRLTEPGLFLKKYFEYPTQKGRREYRIDLAANFRSRKSVLDSVNLIFRQIMSAGVGEINYDQKAELISGAGYKEEGTIPSKAVEVHIINRKNDSPEVMELPGGDYMENDEDEENLAASVREEAGELDASQLEARLLAKRIQEMIEGTQEKPGPEFQVFDKQLGDYRSVTYRDIVILLRATKGWANAFMEEFRMLGIPAYAELGSGYFEATEIETMLALLRVIDNPRQDIPLVGVLRSPIVGLNANELSLVRLADMKGDYYDSLKAFAEVDESDIKGRFKLKLKINTFLDRLDKWRTLARQAPLTDLIWHIYRETGYYDYVGAMVGGSERQANLRALQDRAMEYESTNLRGLFRFLRFIERIRDKGNDLGAARSLGENENVVRIMSIHKSKGLEFPVVIVAGMGKGFNFMDLKGKYLLHKEWGIGIDAVDLGLRVTYATLFKKALQQKLKLETLAEEMRLLYVAMTRAREKLLLVGAVGDLTKEAEKWGRCYGVDGWQLPDFEMAKANSYLHWLGSALMRHSSAQSLRSLLNYSDNPTSAVAADPSQWEIFLHGRSEAAALAPVQELADDLLDRVKALQPVPIRGESYEKLAGWMSWKYPYRALVAKPAKMSVSEIKRRFDSSAAHEDESSKIFHTGAFMRPLFMQQSKGLTPAERGSAMHLVMQHLDFLQNSDAENITKQVNELVNKEILTAEQAAAVDIRAISKLFTLPLGKRLLASVNVQRELPFTFAMPAEEVYLDLQEKDFKDERVLVQGVIDCLFAEEDGLVLLDYKTDRVIPGEEEQLVHRYHQQLNLYTRAVENIFFKPVKEKWLYLFHTGTCVEVK